MSGAGVDGSRKRTPGPEPGTRRRHRAGAGGDADVRLGPARVAAHVSLPVRLAKQPWHVEGRHPTRFLPHLPGSLFALTRRPPRVLRLGRTDENVETGSPKRPVARTVDVPPPQPKYSENGPRKP